MKRGFTQEESGRLAEMSEPMLPRLIRLRDAPRYLGMDPNRFNVEVRPYLIEIPVGKQRVAFDRLDPDAWVDQYKDRNGRPGKAVGGKPPWDGKFHQDSENVVKSGTSGRQSEIIEYEKARERAISLKQRDT